MVDFKTYIIITTLNISVFNRYTHCFNNIYKLCGLQQLLWLHLLGIWYAFTLFNFSGKNGILSGKMQRNEAASNDQLANRIKHL